MTSAVNSKKTHASHEQFPSIGNSSSSQSNFIIPSYISPKASPPQNGNPCFNSVHTFSYQPATPSLEGLLLNTLAATPNSWPFHGALSDSFSANDSQNDLGQFSREHENCQSNPSLDNSFTTTTVNSASSINTSYSKPEEIERSRKTNKARTCYLIFYELVVRNLILESQTPGSEIKIRNKSSHQKLEKIFNSFPEKIIQEVKIKTYKNIEKSRAF